jgi:hypothetical protein
MHRFFIPLVILVALGGAAWVEIAPERNRVTTSRAQR